MDSCHVTTRALIMNARPSQSVNSTQTHQSVTIASVNGLQYVMKRALVNLVRAMQVSPDWKDRMAALPPNSAIRHQQPTMTLCSAVAGTR